MPYNHKDMDAYPFIKGESLRLRAEKYLKQKQEIKNAGNEYKDYMLYAFVIWAVFVVCLVM